MTESSAPPPPPANSPPAIVHFPGLNALRFYAASSVVIAHINDQFKTGKFFDLFQILFLESQRAVNLFFVLSGFLITYLLLKERHKTGTVAIKKFFMRRALRIWPVYYVIAIIGFGVLPLIYGASYHLNDTPPLQIAFTFLLLPQFANLSPPLVHLWSVGLEEQFYLIWPWLLRRNDYLLRGIVGVFFIKLLMAPFVAGLNSEGLDVLYDRLRFECMAIGGLGAYFYINQHWILAWIYRPLTQLIAFGSIVYIPWLAINIAVLQYILESGMFLIIILNVATNQRCLVKLEHPLLDRLGHISYGIYMYHFPIIYVIVRTLWGFNLTDGLLFKLIVTTGTLAMTLVVADLSYRWVETPFLNLKERFAIIRSRG